MSWAFFLAFGQGLPGRRHKKRCRRIPLLYLRSKEGHMADEKEKQAREELNAEAREVIKLINVSSKKALMVGLTCPDDPLSFISALQVVMADFAVQLTALLSAGVCSHGAVSLARAAYKVDNMIDSLKTPFGPKAVFDGEVQRILREKPRPAPELVLVALAQQKPETKLCTCDNEQGCYLHDPPAQPEFPPFPKPEEWKDPS
jgi:hypothetical protein